MPASASTIQATLKTAIEFAHRTMEATMADVTDELSNRPAPGCANSIGATYAHAVFSEDAWVNGHLKGGSPLWATTWAGRTGADKLMPARGIVEGDMGEWCQTVKLDLASFREYAKAVYASAESFIGSTDDATLAREVDSPVGKLPAAAVFAVIVVGHYNNHCGEISAIKGTGGLRGYPF